MKHPSSPLLTGLAGVLLALTPACELSIGGEDGSDGETESASELRRAQPTKVRARRLERREMVRTLTTSREVQSEQEIEILPRAQGVIVEIRVEEGDRVTADDVLAVLDQRDSQAAVSDAEIALQEAKDAVAASGVAKNEAAASINGRKLSWEKAKRDFERNEKTNLISAQDLDQLRVTADTTRAEYETAKLALERAQFDEKAALTAVDRAQVALDRAKLTLSYTEIVAPIDGVIATRSIKIGDSVANTEAAFVLTDHENLIVVFPRPQRELALFSRDVRSNLAGATPLESGASELEITATAEALPGAEFDGKIQRISPSIDPQNGSFRVTAHLEQPAPDSGKPRLLPGMLVQLSIITERHPNAYVVPKRALKREGDTDLIFVTRDDKAVRVEVEEGFSDDDNVEIFPLNDFSLRDDELVIFVGNRDLEDGGEVEVEEWDANGPVVPDTGGRDSEAPGASVIANQVATSETQGQETSPPNEPSKDETADGMEAANENDSDSPDEAPEAGGPDDSNDAASNPR